MKRVPLSALIVLITIVVYGAAAQNAQVRRGSLSRDEEMKAEDEVAKLVQVFRQQKALPKLHRIHDSHLRADACESAQKGRVTGSLEQRPNIPPPVPPSGVFGDVGNLSTFTYATSNPNQIPGDLQSWAARSTYEARTPERFGVGVCFSSTAEHPEGIYWIDVAYYMGAVKTFLYRVTFMWD